jgi:hypothetical protein
MYCAISNSLADDNCTDWKGNACCCVKRVALLCVMYVSLGRNSAYFNHRLPVNFHNCSLSTEKMCHIDWEKSVKRLIHISLSTFLSVSLSLSLSIYLYLSLFTISLFLFSHTSVIVLLHNYIICYTFIPLPFLPPGLNIFGGWWGRIDSERWK